MTSDIETLENVMPSSQSSTANQRLSKSFKNARVAIFINIALLVLAFYSRKIFIDILGVEVTGMNSTLSDLLGLLNLAELGVLSAIAYSLYKPLFDKDQQTVNRIISLMGYLYRIIGFAILGGGVILSCFLPLMYGDKGVDMTLMYMGFYTLLTVNLLSYFFNYKQNLLVADHRNYVIVSTLGLSQVGKVLLQIVFLRWVNGDVYTKYMSFLAIELVFSIIYTIVINKRVLRFYPWLNSSYALGRSVKGEYPEIFKKIRQVFSHKFGGFVLLQTDSIVISLLVGWSVVAYYTNYMMIFTRLTRLVFAAFDNLHAGVGSLAAEGNRSKVVGTYHQLNAMFFWLAGTIVINGFFLTKPFIMLWLGDSQYVLDNSIFVILLLNVYIAVIRRPQDIFLSSHGVFHDTWAPWVEAGLHLGISVALCLQYGLIGVLIGTLVSTLVFALGWKPYLMFREVLYLPFMLYCRTSALFMGITIFTGAVMWTLYKAVGPIESYFTWAVVALVMTLITGFILGLGMYLTNSGMRNITRRLAGVALDRVKGVVGKIVGK